MIDSISQADLFRAIYSDLLVSGLEVTSRNMNVIELCDYTMEFPPYVRWINFEARNFKLDYFKREFLWYLNGDPKDLSICKHAKTWNHCIDDHGRINSNYGYYWFRKPPFPFNFVVEQLKQDKFSRRASMPIIAHEHMYIDNPDIPCTGYLNFRIRNEQLNCSVHMRSQDAIYGLGNDLPSFSILQEMILKMLTVQYPDLEMGHLILHVDSFHFYLKHAQMIADIAEYNSKYIPIHEPRIWNRLEVEHLLATNRNSIFNGFAFTSWLREVEHVTD